MLWLQVIFLWKSPSVPLWSLAHLGFHRGSQTCPESHHPILRQTDLHVQDRHWWWQLGLRLQPRDQTAVVSGGNHSGQAWRRHVRSGAWAGVCSLLFFCFFVVFSSVNAEFYCNVLWPSEKNLWHKRPEVWCTNSHFIHISSKRQDVFLAICI